MKHVNVIVVRSRLIISVFCISRCKYCSYYATSNTRLFYHKKQHHHEEWLVEQEEKEKHRVKVNPKDVKLVTKSLDIETFA